MRKSLLRMTLRQLQVFRAVCEHRSYSRAAETMALTQPAVSLQIRQLEEQVGLPLFEYVGRKLYLTEAAESLLETSADIFDRLAASVGCVPPALPAGYLSTGRNQPGTDHSASGRQP